jgi:hypothetical protein
MLAARTSTSRSIAINQSDILPFQGQISNLSAKAIDINLETPGGAGEVVNRASGNVARSEAAATRPRRTWRLVLTKAALFAIRMHR